MFTGQIDGEGRLVSLIGGSGFIGSSLTKRLLDNNYRVRIIDIAPTSLKGEGVEYRHCDINDFSELTACLYDSDIVINLAAEHKDNVQPVSLYDKVNVEGARVLCRVASLHGIKHIIFTSSVAVYGLQPREADELTPPAPNNPYGSSKTLAEAVYRDWFDENPQERRLTIVRPTVVFGPGNRGNVYNIFKQASAPIFVMVGKGTNRKSMAFVENLSSYLIHCLSNTNQEGFQLSNYCDRPNFTMTELIAKIRGSLGLSSGAIATIPYSFALFLGAVLDGVASLTRRNGFAISRVRIEKFCAETVFSAERAHGSGFRPPYRLSDAIEQTVRFEFGK